MFKGTFQIHRKGNKVWGSFVARTPRGPMRIRSLPRPIHRKVGDEIVNELMGYGSYLHPDDYLVRGSHTKARQILGAAKSFNPEKRKRAREILRAIRQDAFQGHPAARDILLAIRAIEKKKGKAASVRLMPFSWANLKKNLDKSARQYRSIATGKMLYEALHNPNRKEGALKLLRKLSKSQDPMARVITLTVRQYALVDVGRVKPQIMGWGLPKFVKKAAKSVKKSVKKAAKTVKKAAEPIAKEVAKEVKKTVSDPTKLATFAANPMLYAGQTMQKKLGIRDLVTQGIASVNPQAAEGLRQYQNLLDKGLSGVDAKKALAAAASQDPRAAEALKYVDQAQNIEAGLAKGSIEEILSATPAMAVTTDLVARAKEMNPEALKKLSNLQKLAQAGVPKAQQAMAMVKASQSGLDALGKVEKLITPAPPITQPGSLPAPTPGTTVVPQAPGDYRTYYNQPPAVTIYFQR